VLLLGGTAFSLLVELTSLYLAAEIVSLVSVSLIDDLSKQTCIACVLGHRLRPGALHLTVELGSDDTSKFIVIKVVDVVYLVSDFASTWLLDSINFEGVFRTTELFNIAEEHFVVLGPELIFLLQQVLGVNIRFALRVELPPSLAIFALHVEGKFLTMDTDSLLTKLLSVFFDHLLAALISDFSISLSFCVLLLHSEEAHFALIKSLFRVLDVSNVGL